MNTPCHHDPKDSRAHWTWGFQDPRGFEKRKRRCTKNGLPPLLLTPKLPKIEWVHGKRTLMMTFDIYRLQDSPRQLLNITLFSQKRIHSCNLTWDQESLKAYSVSTHHVNELYMQSTKMCFNKNHIYFNSNSSLPTPEHHQIHSSSLSYQQTTLLIVT